MLRGPEARSVSQDSEGFHITLLARLKTLQEQEGNQANHYIEAEALEQEKQVKKPIKRP